jgi:HD-GYP domain
MQGHAREGFQIMSGQKGLHPEILKAILQHHERYDGRGYPQGLKGPGHRQVLAHRLEWWTSTTP